MPYPVAKEKDMREYQPYELDAPKCPDPIQDAVDEMLFREHLRYLAELPASKKRLVLENINAGRSIHFDELD
jgi:hypothetical protein